mmetsp:Transcript_11712/g.27427  ORF Transcript_11712/g.27427 Transcript_11712/m.27427 type:complete len:380 (+) Transcript_11712:422-1561(+)
MAAASRALDNGNESQDGDDRWELIFLSTVIPLCIIATIVIVASLVFLHRFRNKPIVAMGQPRLLSVMCAGSLLILVGLTIRTAAAFAGLEGNDETWKILCGTSACFIHSGISMVDLSLFFKLYRVYKVTQFRHVETIRPRHIRLPFLLGVMVSLVLSLVQVCLSFENQTDFEDCHLTKTDVGPAATIISFVNIAILLLFRLGILVFAYKLRNVDESIGDTRRIMRYFALAFFLSIPVSILFFLKRNFPLYPKIRTIVLSWIWALAAMAAPAFLVLPRMYLVWYEQEYGNFPSEIQMYGTGEVHVCCKTRAAAEAASAAAAATTTTTTATESATTTSQERSRTIHWADSLIIKVDRNDDKGKKGKDDDLECREIEEEENV